MMSQYRAGFATFLFLLSAVSAASEHTQPHFQADIQPILDSNCVACHQMGAAQQGLILEAGKSYAALVGRQAKEADLALVQPGDSQRSYLMLKITGKQAQAGGSGARMPLGGVLDAASVETLQAWIEAGAKAD